MNVFVILYHIFLHISLCAKLSIKLVNFLIHGTRLWVNMAGRLLLFTILLIPGWYHLLVYFFFSPNVVRNVPYSSKSITSRNYLDIYLPPSVRISRSSVASETEYRFDRKVPVIIFVSGGAWIIGYKMWSALVARALSAMGTLVICPDYRNAPQGSIEDMMEDISVSIKWTIQNIGAFGGDPEHIVLAGQSAGAHISVSLILDAFDHCITQHLRSNSETGIHNDKDDDRIENTRHHTNKTIIASSSSSSSSSSMELERLHPHELEKIKLVVGISGPYNLHILRKHLHKRGLDTSILDWVCNNDVDKYSPTLKLQRMSERFDLVSSSSSSSIQNVFTTSPIRFPAIALYHGSNDVTVPASISEEFANELKKFDVDVSLFIYQELSHTDLILEGPLIGDNQLLRDMMKLLTEQYEKYDHSDSCVHTFLSDSTCEMKKQQCHIHPHLLHNNGSSKYNRSEILDIDKPLAPKWLVHIARKMNPF